MNLFFTSIKNNAVTILLAIYVVVSGTFFVLPVDNVLLISGSFILFFILLYFLLLNKKWFIYLTVFSIPLSVLQSLIGGSVISFPSELLAVVLGVVYFIKNVLKNKIDKRIFQHPLSIILIIEVCWLFLTTATSSLPLVSLKRTLITSLYIYVYYFILVDFFAKRENIMNVFFAFALGLLIPITSSIIYHAHYNFTSETSYEMCRPFFNDHTIYGACMAFVIPIFVTFLFHKTDLELQKNKYFLVVIIFIILFIAVLLSFSRAAWLSLILSFLFFIVIKLKVKFRLLLLFLGIFFLILFFTSNSLINIIKQNDAESNKRGNNITQHIESVTNIQTDASNVERINRWKCAIRMFQDRPMFGFGPGTYQFNYGSYQVISEMTRISTFHGNRGHAHSEYLNHLSESGFIGFLNFLLFVLFSISTGLKLIYKSTDLQTKYLAQGFLLALITFFTHAVFNGFLDIDKIAMLVYGSTAALAALDIRASDPI